MLRSDNRRGGLKWLIVLVAAFLLAALVITSTTLDRDAEAQNSSSTDSSVERDGFEMVNPTDRKIEGSLVRSGIPQVEFESEVTGTEEALFKGQRSSDKMTENDKVAITKVDVGSLSVDAQRNLKTQTVVLDGHGKEITARQKKALTALCRELEQSFGALGTELPPSQDLLLRSVCYQAEAPVGYMLTRVTEEPPSEEPATETPETAPTESASTEFVNVSYRQIPIGEVGEVSDVVSDVPTPQQCEQAQNLKDSGNLEENSPVYVACQRASQYGISYLTCRGRTHRLRHDSRFHCYRTKRLGTGPCSYKCRGHCGPRCGLIGVNGAGTYSRDCAEHDRCAGHDGGRSAGINGNDRSCGDEFRDARDDFLRGRINCSGVCRR